MWSADRFFSGTDLDLAWFSSRAIPYILSNLCNLFSPEDPIACSTQRKLEASREFTKYEHNPVLSSLSDSNKDYSIAL